MEAVRSFVGQRSALWAYAAVVVAICVASLFVSQSASASMATNSRLNYGNAGAYCGGGFAKGMVWLSNNEGDYYSETVSVSANANSVRVSIRGAVNSCATSFGSASGNWRYMYAVDVSTSYLSGMSSSTFYRGRIPANSRYTWSSVGDKLYGTLDVSRVARCRAGDLTSGRATGTINVDISRRQVQRNEYGTITHNSPNVGTETVPVRVVRTCPTYNYNLIPSITSFADNAALETPRSNLTVSGSVNNGGATQSRPNTQWRITQLVYNSSYSIPNSYRSSTATTDATVYPCQHYAGESDCDIVESGTRSSSYPTGVTSGHNGVANIRDYPVGTQICYVLSVRPYNASADRWRHSQMRCYRVGVKPKVAVIGGDLYVGRAQSGFTGTNNGRVVTSRSVNSTGTYGSWVEYAMAPTGPVTTMASGSGYVGGNPLYPNILTFANSGQTGSACATTIGCYDHAIAQVNVASRYPVTSSSPDYTGQPLNGLDDVYRSSATAVSIPGSTIGPGRSIIVNAPRTNVTITGNIINNSGTMNNYGSISQVVIIAQNITINENVTRVDAWLIAPGTVSGSGTTVSNGVIRTCNVANASLNSRVCNQRLVVNGPVIANRLQMARTGQVGTNTAAGDPAEIFNFRPDAYLWALSEAEQAGRVTTIETKELPPRY